MRKRLLSLLLCLCMVCSLSTTVLGAETFYTNSVYADMQNILLEIKGNDLIVSVYDYYGGDNDKPPIAVVSDSSGDRDFLLVQDEYSWNVTIPIYENSEINLYSGALLLDEHHFNEGKFFMMRTVYIDKTDSGLKFNGGKHKANNQTAHGVMESVYKHVNAPQKLEDEPKIIGVNSLVRALADDICAKLPSGATDIDKAHAFYLWICRNIAYDKDSFKAKLVTDNKYPSEVIIERTACCWGLANLFSALCNSQEIHCRVVSGVNGSGEHVWNEFYTKGADGIGSGWYFVDCTGGVRKKLENGKVSMLFDENDPYYSYLEGLYFMPVQEYVDTYYKCDTYAPVMTPTFNESDAFNTSEWAIKEIISARDYDLLPEVLCPDDFTQPASRDYFADLIVQYIKSEYVAYKTSNLNFDKSSDEYFMSKGTIKSEINNKLLGIAKGNPAYKQGKKLGYEPSSEPKIGMAFCNEVGIIAGKGDAGLCPNDTLTRAEAATMLHRLFNYMKTNGFKIGFDADFDTDKFILKSFDEIKSNSYFVDHKDIPEWALNGCYGCKDNGIIKGDETGRFLPNNELTAEQCVAIFVRLLNTK